MSTENNPGHGTAPPDDWPGPGDGEHDADVLFLNPAARRPRPGRRGPRAAAGAPGAAPGDRPDGDDDPATRTTPTPTMSRS